jgi:phosphoribosylamine--glycine ligase/phosphoribosylformylglycinamidine cyclo-ligase
MLEKNVLIIGTGGREHALAEALSIKSNQYNTNLYFTGNSVNPGMLKISNGYKKCTLDRFDLINEFINEKNINNVIIGPEAPLAEGIVDNLFYNENKIYVFGPKRDFAKVESSKSYCREIMNKYGLNKYSPNHGIFNNLNDTQNHIHLTFNCIEYLYKLNSKNGFVIKNDSLCGGKGVFVSDEHVNLESALDKCKLFFEKRQNFLIEEKLFGPEFSLMTLSDGKSCKHFPIAVDFKRAYEKNEGPNTGGMGSICFSANKVPFLTNEQIAEAEEVNKKMLDALKNENNNEGYVGILYGSFMLTEFGIKVIEYNCRFGDPECLSLLSLLKTPFIDILTACSETKLNEIELEFSNEYSICKYFVPQNYPDNPNKHELLNLDSINKIAEDHNLLVRYASVNYDSESAHKKCISLGSRTFAFVSLDKDNVVAYNNIENGMKTFFNENKNFWWRKDIGALGEFWEKKSISFYKNAGVNIEAGDEAVRKIQKHLESTWGSEVVSKFGDFSGLISLNKRNFNNSSLLVASIDGVGTKSHLVMDEMGSNGLVSLGKDLVNHCVNDTLVKGSQPLLFMDYIASAKLDPECIEKFVSGVAEACKESNCALIGGETAEMPGTYISEKIDIVGAMIGTVDKKNLIEGHLNIYESNVIIGLKSTSPHTNGYSLVRKLIEKNNTSQNVMNELIKPHRNYYPVISKLDKMYSDGKINTSWQSKILGMCHITGGGFPGNVPRVLPTGLCAKIKWDSWKKPDWYKWVLHCGVSLEESREVFNCGVGMMLFVKKEDVEQILAVLQEGFIMGSVEKGDGVSFI